MQYNTIVNTTLTRPTLLLRNGLRLETPVILDPLLEQGCGTALDCKRTRCNLIPIIVL